MKKTVFMALACLLATASWAKIPAPVLDDAGKAKAEEAKAKTAWTGKMDAFQLCKAQDRVAAYVAKNAKAAAKTAATPSACADPGPFVSTLPGAAPAPAVAVAAKPAKKS
jgi:hypothetical protein